MTDKICCRCTQPGHRAHACRQPIYATTEPPTEKRECTTCIDAQLPGSSEPCCDCEYPSRPHWWPAVKGARP